MPAWLSRFRRLAIRYERRADLRQAFLSLACAPICARFLAPFCEALLAGHAQGAGAGTGACSLPAPAPRHAAA